MMPEGWKDPLDPTATQEDIDEWDEYYDENWGKRDKKRAKRRHGMRVSGKGFVHIINRLRKRGKK